MCFDHSIHINLFSAVLKVTKLEKKTVLVTLGGFVSDMVLHSAYQVQTRRPFDKTLGIIWSP